MSTTDKKLAPGQARFKAKQMTLGKSSRWGVYDVARASFPASTIAFGLVAQNHLTESEAQIEVDRLNAKVLAQQ